MLRAAGCTRRGAWLRACLVLAVLPALVLATGSAPPRDGALQPDPSLKLVITPTFGQCFSNGTTTFRSNAPVTWQLFPMDGAVPYTATRATPTSLTLRAGRHGGRMLVVATASGCAAGSACAEQLGSPSCAGVASGETTLAQVGVNLCSAAFANASWTVVPWWKVRHRRGLQAGGLACGGKSCELGGGEGVPPAPAPSLAHLPSARACADVPPVLLVPQVVGVTLMLTSLGVLFALAVVARVRLASLDDSAATTGLGQGGYGLPSQVNSRLAMAFGGHTAPLFQTQHSKQQQADAASIYA